MSDTATARITAPADPHATIAAPGPVDVEGRAVAWLAAHRDFLDPANGSDSTALFARKAVVEVALLVGMRARLDPTPLGPDYRALLDTIESVAGRWSYRDLVRRDRRALLLYAGTCAALRLCGREDADLRHAVESAVRGRYATCFERVPYRHLDLVHTLELAGIDLPGPGLAEAMPLTLLAADPNALELSTSDTYAITHAIFYATDFGRRTLPGVATDVVALLDECLVLALADSDADLVGELLMCLTCVHAAPSPAQRAARRWLQGWQEPDGRLEGPPGVIPQRLAEADPAWGSWATAYHTTVVAALDDLLRRTAGPPAAHEVSARVHVAPGRDRAVRAALGAAARWLDDAAAGSDLRRVWAAEALLSTGSWQAAGDVLAPTGAAWTAHPGQGLEALTLHVAAVCTVLGVASPEMRALIDAAERMLGEVPVEATEFDAARALVGRARARDHRSSVPIDAHLEACVGSPAAGSRGEGQDSAGSALRARSLGLVADLVRRGPAPVVASDPGSPAVRLLASAARRAVADYDPGWLAVTVRGLARLPGAPDRLVRDALELIVGQQARSGAVGAPLVDDPEQRRGLQLEWTALALPALLEGGTRLGCVSIAGPPPGQPGTGPAPARSGTV